MAGSNRESQQKIVDSCVDVPNLIAGCDRLVQWLEMRCELGLPNLQVEFEGPPDAILSSGVLY